MKKRITLAALVVTLSAYAQQPAGQFKMPSNIIDLCKNIENSILQGYRTEIEANRSVVNAQLTAAERNDAYALSEAAKKYQRVDEERWHKLGCTSLIYKK
jgi:hypothetical protein